MQMVSSVSVIEETTLSAIRGENILNIKEILKKDFKSLILKVVNWVLNSSERYRHTTG